MEMNYVSPSPNIGTELGPKNIFNRLLGIWFSPGETFAEIGRTPRVLVPLLLLMIITVGSLHSLTERYGRERLARERIETLINAGWIPQGKTDEVIQQSVDPAALNRGMYTQALSASLGMLAMVLIITSLIKIFSLLMGAENNFKQLLSVTLYSFLAIALIHTPILIISINLKDPAEIDMLNPVGSNLGAVLELLKVEPPKFVGALTTFVDVFSIWRLILMAIGYSAVSRKLNPSTVTVFVVILYAIVASISSAVASLA